MLDRELQQKIISALTHIPLTASIDGRTTLLAGIPSNIVSGLNRNANQLIDLYGLVNQLDDLGHLEDTGKRPLLLFLENAQKNVAGTSVGTTLELIIQEIKKDDQNEINLIQEHLESLIYGGSEERLDYYFFWRATEVTRSIARLRITRFFGPRCDTSRNPYVFGTGWLITPDLLLTNYHVIEARNTDKGEQRATVDDCKRQVLNMQIRFDYLDEDSLCIDCRCQEIVHYNETLDYALLRLDYTTLPEYRSALQLAQPQWLNPEDRLNIAQYANGQPLKFAIRNNFFLGNYSDQAHIHYVTDTENGSSGAPVCNDSWQVVAMHCKTAQVSPQIWKGETIRYHNVGIEIHAILNDLPSNVYQEIVEAQERA